ncbi:concanavalin A-like lectin/glucanase domain-containing protein [Melampsora americana]|nr:concanavalin A-like lectin/glucanase domain-containing protein [Melampsora americana]
MSSNSKNPYHSQHPHLIILSLTYLLFISLIPSTVNGSADAIRDEHFSFRGPLPEDGHIPNWDISGTTHRIPTAKDYLRLVTPFPLAYGGIFTEKPIPFDQWSVEIAFRIHGGPGSTRVPDPEKNHTITQIRGKGGRGLAFWYTKTSNPTKPVIPADPKAHPAPPPLMTVDMFPDPLDKSVSFFGGPTNFDGLGVIFDNQPFSPVTLRSDRIHWSANESGHGADEWAIVSGVMDDGQGHTKWIEDKPRSEFHAEDEAAYLRHVIGDCQVGLRNAQGLIWAKITHVAGTVSLHLDVTPHTTLAGSERHYTRECFFADNVKLPKGYYVGLTGLASPNEEPDNMDIYAIDVKEIKGHAENPADVIEHDTKSHTPADDVVLEGTGGIKDMTFETINAQRQWAESVQKLTNRLDQLSNSKWPSAGDDHKGSTSAQDHFPEDRLGHIEKQLDNIAHKLPEHSVEKLLEKLEAVERRLTDHETFISVQIEGLRHLILHPPSSSFKDDDHFKPLSTQHEDPFAPPQGYEPPPVPHVETRNRAAESNSPPKVTWPHDQFLNGHHNPHSTSRSWWNILGWLTGILLVIGVIFIVIKKKNKDKSRYAEEGSFTNSHGQRGSSISLAMDTIGPAIGFRQRSKKMI